MKPASEYAAAKLKALGANSQPLTAKSKITNMQLFTILADAYMSGFKDAGKQAEGQS